MNEVFIITISLIIPFLLTVLGASLIFFFKKESVLTNTIALGFASGIMIAASIFSLILPSLDFAQPIWGDFSYIPVLISLVLGGVFILILNFFCDKITSIRSRSSHSQAFKLFSAMTLHNIPEGICVGFAVGTAFASGNSLLAAFFFALGIGIQNFPEGLATALPINKCLKNRKKAFFYGSLSGIVEPVFALLGFFLATSSTMILPWLLSISAGAMIFVTLQEIFPEICTCKHKTIGTWFFLFGFIFMMFLDLAL